MTPLFLARRRCTRCGRSARSGVLLVVGRVRIVRSRRSIYGRYVARWRLSAWEDLSSAETSGALCPHTGTIRLQEKRCHPLWKTPVHGKDSSRSCKRKVRPHSHLQELQLSFFVSEFICLNSSHNSVVAKQVVSS